MKHIDSRSMVAQAYREGYAIAAMNVSNMETAAAVLEAAHRLDCPVLLQVSPLQAQEQKFSYARIVKIINSIAEDFEKGSYSIHLDHATLYEDCVKALDAGFDSVMLDGAALSYEENVAEVSFVRGITKRAVEGELGVVGGGEAASSDITMQYTNPELVPDFLARTGADWLAVAIGNAHGAYSGRPQLDFSILSRIRDEASVPLVLHGASGIPAMDLQKAIAMGVSKINFFTDLDAAYREGLVLGLQENAYQMSASRKAQVRMREKAENLLAVCMKGL